MYASITDSGSSHIRSSPSCIQIAWSQRSLIDCSAWETRTTVRSCSQSLRMRRNDLRLNRASPTDSASSMSRMSGSMFTATLNARRPYMPDE